MYERIDANVRRSWLLIAAFTAFVLFVGWFIGYFMGFGYWALIVAGVISVLMTWASWYSSDKITLAMSRAVPADPVNFQRLHNIVEALSLAAGIPKPSVYVVNDAAPNAFATGRDPQHAAVAVTTGLLEKMNRDELEGVIAHELSHVKNRDTLIMTLVVTLVGIVVLLSDFFLRSMRFGGGRRGKNGGGGGPLILVGLVLVIFAPVFAQLMQFAISRRREFLADADGVFLTRYPPGLISALQKLRDDHTVVRSASRATAHLWIEAPIARSAEEAIGRKRRRSGLWLNRLFDTHPPLDERIRALQTSSLGGAYEPGEGGVTAHAYSEVPFYAGRATSAPPEVAPRLVPPPPPPPPPPA
jgi:heat shock protein HtpX